MCAGASANVDFELANDVNDVLHSLREQQRRPFEITPEIESWLLEAADAPVIPLTGADFASIRERVLARTQASKG